MKTKKTSVYDAYVFFIFLASTSLFYLAFHEYNKLASNFYFPMEYEYQDRDIISYNSSTISAFLHALKTNIVDTLHQRATNAVTRVIEEYRDILTKKATETCMLRLWQVDRDSPLFKKVLFVVSETTLGFVAPGPTSLCIVNTANEYTRIYLQNQMFTLTIYKTHLTTKVAQIYSLVYYSIFGVSSSIAYLYYRVRNQSID